MTLWLLRNSTLGVAAVARAEDPKTARVVAARHFEREGDDAKMVATWSDLEDTSCVAVPAEGEAGVVLTYDFDIE